jgi:hypothetical protein
MSERGDRKNGYRSKPNCPFSSSLEFNRKGRVSRDHFKGGITACRSGYVRAYLDIALFIELQYSKRYSRVYTSIYLKFSVLPEAQRAA